jgi:hypothetical protein
VVESSIRDDTNKPATLQPSAPKPPQALSFAEQIALAANNLKNKNEIKQ